MIGAREFEALTRCRECSHPWELHRSDPDSLDLCQGADHDEPDGVCRCDRLQLTGRKRDARETRSLRAQIGAAVRLGRPALAARLRRELAEAPTR